MIELTDVRFRYSKDGPSVLNGIDLRIHEGELVALIGPNGSGKTTLAELLGGLLMPTEGVSLVDDIPVGSDPWDLRQRVGLVFQNPEHQFFHATVAEDVAFGPENLGLRRDEVRGRVAHALRQVGMEGFAGCSPHRLSGGQKQAVAIAGILAMKPSYLILDEPTSLLDPRGRKRILQIVRELHEAEGCTVLWITQEMEEAAKSERLLVLHEGRIVRDGRPDAVFQEMDFLEEIGLDVPDLIKLRARVMGNRLLELDGALKALLSDIWKDRP
jgi:energy-coupling factor transport system ATP-binding protein